MRLKCGFVLRGILLICLLYSIYIITQDDDFKQAAQKLEGKHSPIENNHQNNHEQAPPGPLKSPESKVKHSKNRFGDLPIPIHKIEDGEEIDFNAPNFQHSDFRDPSIKHDDGIQEAKAYDDFGAVKEPVQALLPKNALKDDTLVKNSIKNSNEHYKQQNIGEIDLSDDPYAGTVQSKKYLNPSIPAAYYDSTKLGNYEVEDPCKGYVKKSNDGECGIPVTLDGEEQKLVPAIIKKFGFNLISGDKVPLDRNPKDLRKPACKNWHYPAGA